jgi:hypothetical protein
MTGGQLIKRRGVQGGRERQLAAHVEFDFASDFDDRFGVMAILEQRIFDRLRPVEEQTAVEAILFLGNPIAAAVFANKHDLRFSAARWRFDELHVCIPSDDGVARAPQAGDLRLLANVRMVVRRLLTHAPNISTAGYEFEGDKTAI